MQTFAINFTEAQLSVVANALGRMPYGEVADVMDTIRAHVFHQRQQAEKTAAAPNS